MGEYSDGFSFAAMVHGKQVHLGQTVLGNSFPSDYITKILMLRTLDGSSLNLHISIPWRTRSPSQPLTSNFVVVFAWASSCGEYSRRLLMSGALVADLL